MSSKTSPLFKPLKVGNLTLQHRVVLAPLTRYRANEAHVPLIPLVSDYYGQRASKPGSLLITEATFIAARAGGGANVPGIWSAEQIEAWKSVTAAVHAKGSFIFLQLWALGRTADAAQLQSEDPTFPYISASDVALPGKSAPRPLSVPEIKEYLRLYVQAAKNAIEAGFDGVEIHSSSFLQPWSCVPAGLINSDIDANGYLLDQFLQDTSNNRTDAYGGSIENRARFTLEVVDAITSAVGPEKTAIRLSPWSPFLGMGMVDPIPTFSYVISQLAARHPDLAYVHLIEPRISGGSVREDVGAHESNEALRALWAPRALIRAGGFGRKDAIEAAERGDLIAFGRHYISNPDLPTRLERDLPLTAYDRSTFFLKGETNPQGYSDYTFATASVWSAAVVSNMPRRDDLALPHFQTDALVEGWSIVDAGKEAGRFRELEMSGKIGVVREECGIPSGCTR